MKKLKIITPVFIVMTLMNFAFIQQKAKPTGKLELLTGKSSIMLRRWLAYSFLLFSFIFAYSVISSFAQGVDQNTLLLLNFENSLNGEQGETPSSAAGYSFQSGVNGQGVSLPAGNQLLYPAANNVNALEGTIEFWIKPSWNGNDNQTHAIFDWNGGDYGGMRIDKNNVNRFSISIAKFSNSV